MSEKRTEKCDCGQVTHLVTIAGVECYDVDVHGSSAAADGKCFNCQKPFVTAQPEPEPTPEPAGANGVLGRMNPQQLRAEGKNYGLTFPVGTTKATMVKAIRSAQAEAEADEDTGDEDTGDDTGEVDDVD